MTELESDIESENSEEGEEEQNESIDDEEEVDQVIPELPPENNITEINDSVNVDKSSLTSRKKNSYVIQKGGCITNDSLDSMLEKIKTIKMRFLNDCDSMKGSLGNIKAQYCEQLQDGISVVRQTG